MAVLVNGFFLHTYADTTAQRSKVGCSALLGLVVAFQSYYYFSLGMSFSKIPERFRNLAQRIPLINDRDDLAGFTQLRYMNQILYVWLNHQDAYLLARGSANPWSQEEDLERV